MTAGARQRLAVAARRRQRQGGDAHDEGHTVAAGGRTIAQGGQACRRLTMGRQAVAAQPVAGEALAAVGTWRGAAQGGGDPAARTVAKRRVARLALFHLAMLEAQLARRDQSGSAGYDEEEKCDADGDGGDPAYDGAALGAQASDRLTPGDGPAARAVRTRSVLARAAAWVDARALPAVVPPQRLAFEGRATPAPPIGSDEAAFALVGAAADPVLGRAFVATLAKAELLHPQGHGTSPRNA